MKKLVLISTLVASLGGLSAFGQGYFQFATGKSQVYDGFSTGVNHVASDVSTAFLWAPSGDVPSVSSILASVPTTATTGNSTWLASAAWTAILNDPNFQLCVNSGTSATAIVPNTTTAGAISYNSGGAFAGPLATAPNGVYSLFFIGWNAAYATPAAAQAAGSAVGWSAAFNYTATAFTSTPNTMIGQTPGFGVAGSLGAVPEPTTMALAGLGGLSLLLFRRRK